MKSLAYTLLVLLGALTVAQAADKPKEETTIYAEEAVTTDSSKDEAKHPADAPVSEEKAK
ncbi:MAG: hypothetical protein BGO67_07565 [Alphaproteobacteria bacterium 41-28]|nr:MAG: hypothetical protein BGO67_07565 [Alphaproteobacteria bacterium 41-28]